MEALAAEKLVADPASVVNSRKDFVLGMSDQVPLWAKAQPKKLLFSEAELSQALPGGGPSLREELNAARTALEETLGEDGPLQVLGGSEEQADSKLKPGSKVKRAHSEADKFRITYEAPQKIRGLCSDGTPSAEVSSGLLVFPGKHRTWTLKAGTSLWNGTVWGTLRLCTSLARNAGLCSGL